MNLRIATIISDNI